MKEKAALAIAALMLVSLAMGITIGTTTTVTGAHTPSVSVDKTKVVGGYSGVFTITVTNASGSTHAIKEVQLTLPSGWSGGNPLKKVPKDNVVLLVGDNLVVLPAGTVLEVFAENKDNIIIPENTDVIIPKYENFYFGIQRYQLLENAIMEPTNDRKTDNFETMKGIAGCVDNEENFKLAKPLTVTLWQDNRLRLLQDTLVILDSDNIVILPENLLAQVVADTNENERENLDVTPIKEIKVKVKENTFRCVSSSLSTSPSLSGVNMSGELVQLVENIVVIPANTVVKIEGNLRAKIPENTQVIRESGKKLEVAAAENLPANWMQATNKWTAIGDNTLAPGSSLEFPVRLTAPSAAGTYTLYVTTTDTAGIIIDTPVQITVDNAAPSLTISVSPSWVKGGVEVTVTVKGNEPFTFDNVFVAENNGENVPLTMTPNADNTEWTGTYTTGENENRDGWATITVVKAKDDLGNSTTVSDNTKLFIDRRKPGKPNLGAMGFPGAWDSKSSFAINWTFTLANALTEDNLPFVPSGYSPENMKLVILVDNAEVATLTAGPTGRVSYALTLSDGKHVVGAYFADKAGNKGEENLENVVIDNNKPTITFVFPENGQYIKDNTPTIQVIIADTVGVENSRVIDGVTDNDGYRVGLYLENGTPIDENLVPSANPTQTDNVAGRIVFTTFTFENTWPTELPDNTYILRVVAGDNLRLENLWIKFTVDTHAPPSPPSTSLVGSITAGTLADPTGTKNRTMSLRGTAEAGATI
ncbi:MAG: hypothetical protein QW098_04960, partial [Candidatus Hadarchaeales archaeon]